MTKDIGLAPPKPAASSEKPLQGVVRRIAELVVPIALVIGAYWIGENYLQF